MYIYTFDEGRHLLRGRELLIQNLGREEANRVIEIRSICMTDIRS